MFGSSHVPHVHFKSCQYFEPCGWVELVTAVFTDGGLLDPNWTGQHLSTISFQETNHICFKHLFKIWDYFSNFLWDGIVFIMVGKPWLSFGKKWSGIHHAPISKAERWKWRRTPWHQRNFEENLLDHALKGDLSLPYPHIFLSLLQYINVVIFWRRIVVLKNGFESQKLSDGLEFSLPPPAQLIHWKSKINS